MECVCLTYIGKPESEMRYCAEIADIRKTLIEVAAEPGEYPVAVYRCEVCGTQWARDFVHTRVSSIEVFFTIPTGDPRAWLSDRQARAARLELRARQNQNLLQLKVLLNAPRTEENCQQEACFRKRMKLSAFCPMHHWEQLSGPMPAYLVELLPKQ